MKLRIRHASVTKVLTLEDGRSYTIGQLKDIIKSQLSHALGLAASINFNLSLNGTASLGDDGLDINQAGIVGGDLLKILVVDADVSSLAPAAGATTSTRSNSSATQVAGSSQDVERSQRDYTRAHGINLRMLYELEAVKTPFHAMCVWLHSLMLENRFTCQQEGLSDIASALQAPVVKFEYRHADTATVVFCLTVTQLGPFALINGIVRPCRNTDPEVISLQVKLSDYVTSFTSKPTYGDVAYKHRNRLGSLFKTDIANKAMDVMRAEVRLPPLRGLLVLPPEMLIKTFGYLEAPALCKLAQTCKMLQQISNDDRLWENLYKRTFVASPISTNQSWKEQFRREYLRRQQEERERLEYTREFAAIPPHPFAPTPDVPIVMPYPGQPIGIIGGDYDLDPGFPYGPFARPQRRNPFGPSRPPLPGNPLPGSRFDPMYPGGRFRPGRGGGMMDDWL